MRVLLGQPELVRDVQAKGAAKTRSRPGRQVQLPAMSPQSRVHALAGEGRAFCGRRGRAAAPASAALQALRSLADRPLAAQAAGALRRDSMRAVARPQCTAVSSDAPELFHVSSLREAEFCLQRDPSGATPSTWKTRTRNRPAEWHCSCGAC